MRPELIHLITRLPAKDSAEAITGIYTGTSSSEKVIRTESTVEYTEQKIF
ncbi:MAG: hypothetical protein U0264_06105 [Candidatus Kapaibacterium sp.]